MYGVYFALDFSLLSKFIDEYINPNKDKVISVTQNGETYTVVYQIYGNKED